jgi:hypothetical protein
MPATPIATQGASACALQGRVDARAASDVPQAWHARDPGWTAAPQDGQLDTIGVPQ